MELLSPAVVLCPPLGEDPPAWRDALAAALRAASLPTIVPLAGPVPPEPDARTRLAGWVADQAITISGARPSGPLLLVASGAACAALPALGMAQRAARHAVVGYVLVDGTAPEVGRSGQDWPDAPVTVVRSSGAPDPGDAVARLRGWTVVPGDPVAVVLDLVRRWPEPLAGSGPAPG
ncbi:MAG: hypothetical protein MUF35_01165 [Candidatus Nanopelagicales bacterium]|nr:hypothetical protein [Candidatus Nanopelagicales bacterium]